MADNTNKVTIDESRYDELRNAEKYLREHPQPPQPYIDSLIKERDELKAKLEKLAALCESTKCIGNECATVQRLAAAEKCIEDIETVIGERSLEMQGGAALKIIDNYREKKDAL